MNKDKCPDCNSSVTLSGSVTCWCDKDQCVGQRCGASQLFAKYTCDNTECKKTGTPEKTMAYYKRHSD